MRDWMAGQSGSAGGRGGGQGGGGDGGGEGGGGEGGGGDGAWSRSADTVGSATVSTVTPREVERSDDVAPCSVLCAAAAAVDVGRMRRTVTVTLAALTVRVTPSAEGKAASRRDVKAARSNDSTVPASVKSVVTMDLISEPGW